MMTCVMLSILVRGEVKGFGVLNGGVRGRKWPRLKLGQKCINMAPRELASPTLGVHLNVINFLPP